MPLPSPPHPIQAGPLLALALGSAALVAGPAPAEASSPQAWAAYGRQVVAACSAASTLRNPRPAGERVDLPAANGSPMSVLLLEGNYPQPHMASRKGLEICLYDGTTRRARVAEADRLHNRSTRQP